MTDQPVPSIALPPSLRDTLPAIYRAYAEHAYCLGQTDLAERYALLASACEYGGVVNLRGAP